MRKFDCVAGADEGDALRGVGVGDESDIDFWAVGGSLAAKLPGVSVELKLVIGRIAGEVGLLPGNDEGAILRAFYFDVAAAEG